MTGFPGRVDTLARQMQPWVEKWHVRQALDAGCGGGALMLALDRLGVTPVGLDLSEPMLRLAISNSKSQGKRFAFHGTSFEMAGRLFPSRFDAAITVGNSIIGAQDDRELTAWLRGLRDTVRPGGHLLIQILNPTPFFLGLKSVIARRTIDGAEFVRVAAPDGDRLNFCAMYLGKDGETRFHFSRWVNWEHRRVTGCVAAAGFAEIQVFGSLEGAPFDERSSTDIVISAKRRM